MGKNPEGIPSLLRLRAVRIKYPYKKISIFLIWPCHNAVGANTEISAADPDDLLLVQFFLVFRISYTR